MVRGVLRKVLLVAVIGSLAGSIARAAEADNPNGKFSGEYMEFSREAGDPGLPQKNDTKVTISFGRKLAVDLYRALGPSAQVQSCDDTQRTRMRRDLQCVFYANSRKTTCWFGISVTTGRSVNGAVC